MDFSQRLASGLLILATALALGLANSPAGPSFVAFRDATALGVSVHAGVNDGLMALFFLLIGLELRRELHDGELSTRDRALLPVIAAAGGMIAPALIHFALNARTPYESGFGIPMATDIAFTLGVLTMLGARVPASLRAFVIAFAVIDDLGAILVIALFYSATLSLVWLAGAAALWLGLLGLDRLGRVRALTPYLLLGAVLWWTMWRSGVHPTLAGVALAFAVPRSSALNLEHRLAAPVALVILPLFALANAGVPIDTRTLAMLANTNVLGIVGGLCIGKPLGIGLGFWLATKVFRLGRPASLAPAHVLGAGLLGGIGFTMSIFIATLAFGDTPATLDASKLAVLTASLASGLAGYAWLRTSAPVIRPSLVPVAGHSERGHRGES
jgi:Na+:H+ antiporter, NhaA family